MDVEEFALEVKKFKHSIEANDQRKLHRSASPKSRGYNRMIVLAIRERIRLILRTFFFSFSPPPTKLRASTGQQVNSRYCQTYITPCSRLIENGERNDGTKFLPVY